MKLTQDRAALEGRGGPSRLAGELFHHTVSRAGVHFQMAVIFNTQLAAITESSRVHALHKCRSIIGSTARVTQISPNR
jgi:hypothetical protein